MPKRLRATLLHIVYSKIKKIAIVFIIFLKCWIYNYKLFRQMFFEHFEATPTEVRKVHDTEEKNPDIYFHKQKRKRTASFFTLSSYSTPHYSFGGRNPLLVFTITLSNTMNMDGSTKITTTILISAPLAIRIHRELIISMLE